MVSRYVRILIGISVKPAFPQMCPFESGWVWVGIGCYCENMGNSMFSSGNSCCAEAVEGLGMSFSSCQTSLPTELFSHDSGGIWRLSLPPRLVPTGFRVGGESDRLWRMLDAQLLPAQQLLLHLCGPRTWPSPRCLRKAGEGHSRLGQEPELGASFRGRAQCLCFPRTPAPASLVPCQKQGIGWWQFW